jgi:hypothetical protein
MGNIRRNFFQQNAKFAAILGKMNGRLGKFVCSGGALNTELSRRSALKEHKFQIGHTVYFTSRPIGHMASNGTYRVVKLLPSDGEDYQYRIKSTEEAFERVAKESQLDRDR